MSVQTPPVRTTWPETVTLRDGTEVYIRPIEPDDKDKLRLGFERLSRESRYRRFLTPMPRLSPRLVRYLTEIDHHDHEAMVAETVEGGEPVGVARYIRAHDDPTSAEVAVTVVDEWQGKGAATALLRRLAMRAMDEGVDRVAATCLATNTDVLDLLEGVGDKTVTAREGDLVEIEVALPTSDEGMLRTALRRAASGMLRFRLPGERRRQ